LLDLRGRKIGLLDGVIAGLHTGLASRIEGNRNVKERNGLVVILVRIGGGRGRGSLGLDPDRQEKAKRYGQQKCDAER